MATVFRKTYTKSLPDGAELFTRKGQRFARWKDSKGKTRTAKVTVPDKGKHAGMPRIVMEAGTFTAKYRDGSRVVREVPTGCRGEQAARQVLADLARRAEHVKAGILTPVQDSMSNHQNAPLTEHVDAYEAHLRAKGVTKGRIKTNRQRFMAVAADCEFNRLVDTNGDDLEQWLVGKTEAGMSAGSRNGYREACVGFGNWCVRTHRLAVSPFANVPKADAKADCRRKRRALTEAELVKLLDVARRRPLLEAMTIRRGKNKGKPLADVKPETRERLERLGRERALIYKTLVLTGLRRNELASITMGQLELDGPYPHLVLHAADEKNREGSMIPLRADLVEDIRCWVDEMHLAMLREGVSRGEEPPEVVPPDTPLFIVPKALVRILDRDLKMAGISKCDDRGRTVDIHAMRHTFGTLLSKGNVAPRTAQAAMRHSSIDLTMNVYTDPRLLDVAGALDALPDLPLDGAPEAERQRATGTCYDRPLAPVLAPTLVQANTLRSTADKTGIGGTRHDDRAGASASTVAVKRREPLSLADNGSPRSGRLDLNQRPLRPERSGSPI